MGEATVFQRRCSCRAFSPEPLPRETLVELLEAARWAPSGGNLQPWRFVVVRDMSRRLALAYAAHGQAFVAEAPAVVVVCALAEVSARHYGERGRELYCLQDTAAAAENLLLRATELGLGSCWVGAFEEEAASRALGLDESWRPVALIPVGWPRGRPPERTRLPLDRVTVWLDEEG
jgi:nitroreductase